VVATKKAIGKTFSEEQFHFALVIWQEWIFKTMMHVRGQGAIHTTPEVYFYG